MAQLSSCLARTLTIIDSADHDSKAIARRPFLLHENATLVLVSPRPVAFRMLDSLLTKYPTGIKRRTGDDEMTGRTFRSRTRLQ